MIGGCCNPDGPSAQRYVCDSCQQNGCCSVYEHCVSCCLQPEKVRSVTVIPRDGHLSYKVVILSDTFEKLSYSLSLYFLRKLSIITETGHVQNSETKDLIWLNVLFCIYNSFFFPQQPLLRKILSKATDTFQYLFASVADHFELCLAKCRTSSQVTSPSY